MATPTTNRICYAMVNPYSLDEYTRSNLSAAYSTRKLKSNVSKVIRICDDTGTQTDIGCVGENLDEAGMLGWLGRNLVAGVPLGVDGNADGVSDGWTKASDTGTGSFEANATTGQKLTITTTSAQYQGKSISKNIPCIAGNSVTFTFKVWSINRTPLFVNQSWYAFYNSSNSLIGSASYDTFAPSGGFINKSYTATAPANTAYIKVGFQSQDNTVGGGGAGSAWFKDASITISNQSAYVATLYDQSGNGNHATQATLANMPRIVNAGIIDRDFDTTKASALYPTFASASGVNLVSNGNFVNTTGWTAVGGSGSASNNTYSLTIDGGGSLAYVIQNTSATIVVGRRYLVKCLVKVTNASCTNIIAQIDGSTSGTNVTIQTITNPTQNQVYAIDVIGVVGADFTGNVKVLLQHTYADAATASGKVMEVQEVVCIDVTALGKPTMYFDSTNDVLSIANSASVDILSAPMMINAVFNNLSVTGYVICKNLDSLITNQYALLSSITNPHAELNLEGSSRQIGANDSMPINTQKIYSGTFETGVQKGYINGVNSGADGTYNGTLTSRANMQIGARSNNAGGTTWTGFFKGYISELIIATDTTKRAKLESSQMKYYQPK